MRFVLLLPLLLAALAGGAAAAPVASIDLGSEWMKVAVVNLKPNHPPISIAINEMSKRKSPALVAFTPAARLLAEEAAALSARFPASVISHSRDLLAKPLPHALALARALYLPFPLTDSGVRVDLASSSAEYSHSEVLAMLLGYCRSLAEAHVRGDVKDAVVAVPAWFGQAERKGMVQAAQLAGWNVLGLINEHAAAALQYGIDKDFSNGSRYAVFYDMGASSTYAALVEFSAYKAKEFGKTVSVNQFQVKDVRWNTRLGGQNMELLLVEYFADEFNKQLATGIDVREFPKAMAKLKKQVKRTKEILSANTVAPISVESLYNDRDFRSTISREKFEELCGDLWDQALIPLKEVLKHSGLKLDDIYAVELIGGATRVPKLQMKLQEFLGRKDLDKHLDADEAIVLGASLHAANLSDGIKLNRKLGMIDGSSYGFVLQLEGEDLVKDENTETLLVPRMKKMPIKLFRSIKHNKDFDVTLSYDNTNDLPPGLLSNKFAQFSVSGLTEASEKYASRNLSAPIKASLHFSLSRSGIISFDRAEAVIEISEWVEVPKKNVTLESNATDAQNMSNETSPSNNSEEKETLNSDNEAKKEQGSNIEEQIPADVIAEKVLKKKTFRVPLKIEDKSICPGILSKDSYAEAKNRLEALDKKDAERRKTAESKNNLEEYIYATREKLEDNADIEKVSTEKERQSFVEKLNEVQEWLYTDGEDAAASEFKERLDSLKVIGDPIFFRLNELTARPRACEHARTYLGELQEIVSNWGKNKSWLPKSRIDEILSEGEKIRLWLDEKAALQKKTPLSSTPVFTSSEVVEKVLRLQDQVASVNRIPKPKPKVEKPAKEKESKDNSSSSSADEATSQTEEPVDIDEPVYSPAANTEDGEADAHDEL